MKIRFMIVAAVVVLIIGASRAYAADVTTGKQTNQQLEQDLNTITAEAMDRPRTRLDQALLDFHKQMAKREGK